MKEKCLSLRRSIFQKQLELEIELTTSIELHGFSNTLVGFVAEKSM